MAKPALALVDPNPARVVVVAACQRPLAPPGPWLCLPPPPRPPRDGPPESPGFLRGPLPKPPGPLPGPPPGPPGPRLGGRVPPKPPPKPLRKPPAPAEDSGRGVVRSWRSRAISTRISCPRISLPCMPTMAAFASSGVDISTKAKPRGCRVSRSSGTKALTTLPKPEKSSCSSASPTWGGTLFTISLLPMESFQRSRNDLQKTRNTNRKGTAGGFTCA